MTSAVALDVNQDVHPTPSVGVLDPRCKPAPPSQAGTPALGSDDKGPAPSNVGKSHHSEGANTGGAEIPENPAILGTGLRAVAPLDMGETQLQAPATGEPIFERVDPRTLLVEESYQRDLSPRSMKLIEKIAGQWDWRKFKPPVVAFADGGLRIIDGQHTAIGAASRPDITMIPVMIVEAPELQDRAMAFIGHNRDRLAVSAMQMHYASVAAGDEDAATIEQVCARAGVTLVRGAYGGRQWSSGETVAIAAVSGLIDRRGAMRARQILQVLATTDLAPIRPHHVRAAEAIFTDPLYANDVDALGDRGSEDLAAAITALGEAAEREARLYIDARRGVPMWKALAMQWFKKMRKPRKAP